MASDRMIGGMLGHYRVLSALGRGGMGEVFLAEDTTLKRRVAIKTLSARLLESTRWIGRLRREAEALASINHPNVITVHAIAESGGTPFVVMEFVEGSTVADLLPETGFPPARFFELAIPIASAIAAAHERGVVHGDLKPTNVMVSRDGRVKVLDFGLARILGPAGQDATMTTETVPGSVAGTPAYMPLEQLVGEPADRRSDLFSLGVMLFEMATGRRPVSWRTPAELAARLATEEPPDLSTARADLPPRLGRIVRQMLDREPAKRPSGAAHIVTELEASERDSGPRPPVPPPAHATPQAKRPVDLEVMRLVARGLHLWNKRTEESLRLSVGCFQQAIDRDPMHAPAWIGLADALNILSNYGFIRPADSASRVRAAVKKAISLEGETADSLRALALAAWQFDFDWARAEQLYRRAIAMDEDAPLSHYWFGILLGVVRQFDPSFQELRRAEELDPLSLIAPAARGWFTLFAGRPTEAHAMLQRVLSLDPHLHPALWFDGQALTELGRFDEAVESLSEAMRIGGRTPRLLGYTGHTLGRAGRVEEADAILNELQQIGAEGYMPPYFEALVLCGMGDHDRTLAKLESALATNDTMLRDLAIDPPWWRLRGEPRYRAMIDAMGLTAPES